MSYTGPPSVTNPTFRFRRGALEPPGIALTDDDFLVVRSRAIGRFNESGAPTTTYNLEARTRVLSPRLTWDDARLLFTVPAGSDFFVQEQRWPLLRGFLQGAWCGVPAVNIEDPRDELQHGACFVQLGIGKGQDLGNYVHTLLGQGYVSKGAAVGWPGGTASDERQGVGTIQFLRPLGGGAGSEMTINSSVVGGYWRLLGLRAILTTSAAAGNRLVRFVAENSPGTRYYETTAPAVQGPGTAVIYSLAPGMAKTAAVAGIQECAWPSDLWMKANVQWSTFTDNFNAGDVWSARIGHAETFA